MRRIVLVLSILLVSFSLFAANINPITTAFKTGDAGALSRNLDEEVEITLPSESIRCSSKEAIKLLSTFFASNKPNGFSSVHQAEKTSTGFFVGKYTSGENSYRVNVTYKISGDSIIIQSIRIE